MSIYITGDTHGEHSIGKLSHKNWSESRNLTKRDYVIICGDFGLLWQDRPSEHWWLNWLDKIAPFTTLFIDGNHENHHMLQNLESVEMFGSAVGKVNDSVYHLKRGHVYIIEDKKFFCMGGADSTDKEHRVEYRTWWREEIPSYVEFERGYDSLYTYNYNVDYVLTHTVPSSILHRLFCKINMYFYERIDPVSEYLEDIENRLNFKHWYFGHFHHDVEIDDKFTCVYHDIIKI